MLSEKEDSITVHLICPTEKLANSNYLESLDIHKELGSLSVKDIAAKLTLFKNCPIPLKGETYNFAFRGTNPYTYNDQKKNIIMNSNGLPAGSNGAMANSMAKMYQFKINYTIFANTGSYNETTGQASGLFSNVSTFLESCCNRGL